MAFSLHEVIFRKEFDEVIDVMWQALPGSDPSHPVFFPIFGDTTAARSRAIAESKQRLWDQHNADGASRWIYVREVDTGKVVGGCQWRTYNENPFKDGTPTITAYWWPEGPGRIFASEVINQCYTPRTRWMARPHAGLSQMCVLPSHQCRGIGSMLMRWGIDQIDRQDLESFIEATEAGRKLYERFGYREVKRVEVDMGHVTVVDEEAKEWQQLERELLPVGYAALWRPSGGLQDDQEFENTWRERLSL